MNKVERVKRKLERAAGLALAAHELALTIEETWEDRDVRRVTGRAADDARGALREWEAMEGRWRASEASRVRQAEELERLGPCLVCNTGVAANHEHCEACGWSISPGEGRCHNRECERYEGRDTTTRARA